jgi:hypothetical protein
MVTLKSDMTALIWYVDFGPRVIAGFVAHTICFDYEFAIRLSMCL